MRPRTSEKIKDLLPGNAGHFQEQKIYKNFLWINGFTNIYLLIEAADAPNQPLTNPTFHHLSALLILKSVFFR